MRSNTGNTNSEEIEQLAKNDLKVLAEMLGEKEEQVKTIVDDVVEKATEEKDQETREAAFVMFRHPLFLPFFFSSVLSIFLLSTSPEAIALILILDTHKINLSLNSSPTIA